MTRAEAIARAKGARVGHIATVTPTGLPHVVPFVFVLLEEGAALRVYWGVDRKRKRPLPLQRVLNIEANPAVELVVDGYEEAWDRLWWVRLSGTARIVGLPEERAVALSALRAKYPQYEHAPPAGPIVAVEVTRVTHWEATGGLP